MTFSMRRVVAIFQKDLKDLYKNMYVSTTILMPLIFAFFFGRMDEVTVEAHFVVINLTLALVTAFLQCSIIAEEKEKNTLRGLMLSPATIPEILGGKSLVTFILTLVTIILGMLLTGYQPANIGVVAVAIAISSLFYIALGTLLGLISKSVIEASVLVLPVMFIFGMGSLFSDFAEQYPILSLMDYLPNMQLIELANAVELGAGIADVLSNLGIILAWVVVGMVATVIVFKKRQLDD